MEMIIPAEQSHILKLIPDCRWPISFDEANYLAQNSFIVWSGLAPDGRVACMFGLQFQTVIGSAAYMWFIPSKVIFEYKKTFLIESRKFCKWLCQDIQIIRSAVFVDLEDSIRWLEWMGFRKVGDTSVAGRPALVMEMNSWHKPH